MGPARRPPAVRGRLAAALAIAVSLALPHHGARADGDDAPPSLSLGKVLEVTVRQSRTLELASIDVDLADAAVLAATGIDDWVLGVGVSFSSLRTPDFTSDSTRTTNNYDVEGTLSRSLSTGGSFSVTAGSGYSNNPFSLTASESGSWNHAVSATFYQPLLRGRGSRLARAQLHGLQIDKSAEELTRDGEAIGVVRDVIIAYWELAYSRRSLAIRESSLELAKERHRITKASIDAGKVAPTEALAVEQTIATREEEIVAANLVATKRSLDLRRIAGMEIGPGNIELATAASLSVETRPLEYSALLTKAYATSPELAGYKKLEEGALLDVEVAENGLASRLDATVSAGPNGIAATAVDALGNMAKLKGFRVTASLDYEQALGKHSATGNTRGRRLALRRVKLSAVDMRIQIAASLASVVADAQAAEKRMELSERAVNLAEQNITAEQARFDLGRATNFDVAQRQEELKQAQLRFARAQVDYLIATVQIDSITGDLMTRYGVKLEAR